MSKILIIGQALPQVPQQYPYDTTMLYNWLSEIGIAKEQAQDMFEFEAVFNEFTGIDKNGGHLKPSREQMISHWDNTLETKVILADKVWVLGNVAKDFIDKRPKTWSCNTEWLYTMHPSTRNYYQFSLNKEQILGKINSFITGSADFKPKEAHQPTLF